LAYSVTLTHKQRGYEVIQFQRHPELSAKLTFLEFMTGISTTAFTLKVSIRTLEMMGMTVCCGAASRRVWRTAD